MLTSVLCVGKKEIWTLILRRAKLGFNCFHVPDTAPGLQMCSAVDGGRNKTANEPKECDLISKGSCHTERFTSHSYSHFFLFETKETHKVGSSVLRQWPACSLFYLNHWFAAERCLFWVFFCPSSECVKAFDSSRSPPTPLIPRLASPRIVCIVCWDSSRMLCYGWGHTSILLSSRETAAFRSSVRLSEPRRAATSENQRGEPGIPSPS